MNNGNLVFIQPPFLEGEKVYLRALTEEDCLGDYLKWFNDPVVCQYNSHHIYPFDKQQALDYIHRIRNSGRDLVLAIIDKTSNTHIGNISLQEINFIYRSAEFAIIIGNKDAWGKGISKEASRLILDHGFNALNLNRIFGAFFADNIPGRKLATFLKMKEEGKRRAAVYKNGTYIDVIEYGVLKEEFYHE